MDFTFIKDVFAKMRIKGYLSWLLVSKVDVAMLFDLAFKRGNFAKYIWSDTAK